MTRPRLTLPLGSPLQLLLLACSFALSAYAGVRLLDGEWFEITLWIVGAALVHDLVLLPLYAAADRLLVRASGPRRTWVGYVRVPAALSLLLLLVWFPLITGQVTTRYTAATALPADRFLQHWLLTTATLFAGSAVLFVGRWRRRPTAPRGR
ncbi:hypothetical protein [Streptomyces sp. NBC_00588]|uniref:hypothetical protein n=1 Tax=Streptomyces sp. NBC_00588 TaxID=2975784 RepID=UPI002E801C33|nr:hypothetical protein [Streptomyces sp. NBC_00588]WUB35278.1 hypothetical protein OHN38_10290 [Streptomyces sp. NBC_00588]